MAQSIDFLVTKDNSDANSKGVPSAIFIEDEESFLAQNGKTVDDALKALQELYSKYKFMETQMLQQKKSLLQKVPDIQSALRAIDFLIAKKEANESFQSNFELSDNVYAHATVKPDDKVCLWLGANVMLEYTYEEGKALLQSNLEIAERSLSILTSDLSFIKDQVTVSEVNIARMHNHNVRLRQQEKARQAKAQQQAAASSAAIAASS